MQISKTELFQQATKTRFQPDILEKVWRLMTLLEAINKDAYLESRLALVGGTSLNLFIFRLPRLSVDIDLNYVGSGDRDVMLSEKAIIEQTLEALIARLGYSVRRIQPGHKSTQWFLKYPSVVNYTGSLQIDLNYMNRVPLWDTQKCASHAIGEHIISDIRLMNTYDILGSKIAALLDRKTARDFFDAQQIFSTLELDVERFRFACVLYGAMGSFDWRQASMDHLTLDPKEIRRFLIPLLEKDDIVRARWEEKAEILLNECKRGLVKYLFPLKKHELQFLEKFYQEGSLQPQLLTISQDLIHKTHSLPGLKWKIKNLAGEKA